MCRVSIFFSYRKCISPEKNNSFINKNIEYIFNMRSKYNTQHEFINILGHMIVVDYNFFIGLLWMNCRFQGTYEGV